MTFSDQLHAIRSERHITQREAYTRLQIPRRTYENWERGTHAPPPYMQKAVIEQLRQTEKPSS